MKKLFAILLSFSLILAALPETVLAAGEDECSIDMEVTLDDGIAGLDAIGTNFIAENVDTGEKYEFHNTGEINSMGRMIFSVEHLPKGIYLIQGKDPVVYEFRLDMTDRRGVVTNARLFSVNFKDGDEILSSQYVQIFKKAKQPAFVPTKVGYVFDKWVTESGTAVSWNRNINATTNYYASWTSVPTYNATFNIRLDNQDTLENTEQIKQALGSFSLQPADNVDQLIPLTEGEGLSYSAPVPNGRYYIVREGSRLLTDDAVIEIADSDGSLTVPFNSVHFMDGETELETVYVEQGTKIPEAVTAPEKPDYLFKQWVTQKDGNIAFDFNASVSEETWIYASYEALHTHIWSETYEKDLNSHWHECLADGCPITENAQKDGFGEHTFGAWHITVEPTFSKDGEQEQKCTVCEYAKTESVPKLSDSHVHDYTGERVLVKEPTCTEEGTERIYCIEPECGAYIEQQLLKSAHEFDDTNWKQSNQSHWHSCVHCSAVSGLEAHQMSTEPMIEPATESTPGSKKWVCTDCGYVMKTETIPVLHNYTGREEIVKEPTCTEDGIKRIYCAVPSCEEYIEEPVLSHGHQMNTADWEYDEEKHWHICELCGTADVPEPHQMSTEPMIEPATESAPGSKKWVCTDCGYVMKTEVIPALEEEKPSEPTPEPPTEPTPSNPKPSESTPSKAPETGDISNVEMYATLGMIAGMSYLLLYFGDGSLGMTAEEKKEIISKLAGWAKGRNRLARCIALLAIFAVLLYYHSIGKKVEVDLTEVYGK